jgi:hypothetical protein
VIIDLYLASAWADFGGLIPEMREEAIRRVRKKVPDDTHYANLAKLGQNGEPIGCKPAFRMMLMMCQKFSDASEDADSANASTSTDKQVMRGATAA